MAGLSAGSPGDDHPAQDEAPPTGQSGDLPSASGEGSAQPTTDSAPPPSADGIDKPAKNATSTDATSQHIQIKVRSTDSNEVFFRIKKTTPLRKLMDVYCDRLGQPRGTIRFIYEGERITNEDTAQSLGIEDNEVIDAMIQQTGGAAFSARS